MVFKNYYCYWIFKYVKKLNVWRHLAAETTHTVTGNSVATADGAFLATKRVSSFALLLLFFLAQELFIALLHLRFSHCLNPSWIQFHSVFKRILEHWLCLHQEHQQGQGGNEYTELHFSRLQMRSYCAIPSGYETLNGRSSLVNCLQRTIPLIGGLSVGDFFYRAMGGQSEIVRSSVTGTIILGHVFGKRR